MAAQNQALPSPSYPFVDSTGKVNPVWFQFLNSLWQRTGGGSNTGNVQSITVSSGGGINNSVVDSGTNVQINLTLGAISPISVSSSGPVSGTTAYFTTGLTCLGTMQFGAYTNTTITNTGFITIIDAQGTPRRLMVG